MTTGPQANRPVRAPTFTRKRDGERRSPGSIAISLALHVLLGIALIRMLTISESLRDVFRKRDRELQPERISFLTLPKPAPNEPPTPGRRGGNNIPVRPNATPAAPAPPLVAPRDVPTELPPPKPAAPTRPVEDEGTGPLVSGGGPTRGIRPSLSDPRIWSASSSEVVTAPKTAAQRLDSALVARLTAVQDSVAENTYNPNKFERGDWTVGKDGNKWGIDQKMIRLGKFSIPTAILGLLPTQMTGNPIAYERNKTLAAMRAEIMEGAQRAMTEDEFKKAVKRVRERKDRERREAEKKPEKPIAMPNGAGRQ